MNCSSPSFTGGTVATTQWLGNPDNDRACQGSSTEQV